MIVFWALVAVDGMLSPGYAFKQGDSLISSNEGESAKAAAAATVLLIRDRPAFEVLMVTRHEKMAFAAGALVFPGGKVADDDDDPRWQDHAQGWLDLTSEQLALRVTAIREVFEETGLLISWSSEAINSASDTAADARRAICEGRLEFLTFAREAGPLFDLAGLVPFARWITPVSMPRRFEGGTLCQSGDTSNIDNIERVVVK